MHGSSEGGQCMRAVILIRKPTSLWERSTSSSELGELVFPLTFSLYFILTILPLPWCFHRLLLLTPTDSIAPSLSCKRPPESLPREELLSKSRDNCRFRFQLLDQIVNILAVNIHEKLFIPHRWLTKNDCMLNLKYTQTWLHNFSTETFLW